MATSNLPGTDAARHGSETMQDVTRGTAESLRNAGSAGTEAARAAGDFAEADRLRDEIAELGWEVRDVPGGFELYRL